MVSVNLLAPIFLLPDVVMVEALAPVAAKLLIFAGAITLSTVILL